MNNNLIGNLLTYIDKCICQEGRRWCYASCDQNTPALWEKPHEAKL
jgi:hypothetical protein